MIRIRVDPDQMEQIGVLMRQTAGELRAIEQRLRAALGALDWEARSRAGIQSDVAAAGTTASTLSGLAEQMAAYLMRKAAGFRQADQAGQGALHLVNATYRQEMSGQLAEAKRSWWEAKLRGDQAGMDAAHAAANHLRQVGAQETDEMNRQIYAEYEFRDRLLQSKRDWWQAWSEGDQAGMEGAHARANELRSHGVAEPSDEQNQAVLRDALITVKHGWWQARLRGDANAMAAMQDKADYLRAQGAVVSDAENQAINDRYEQEYASNPPPPPAGPLPPGVRLTEAGYAWPLKYPESGQPLITSLVGIRDNPTGPGRDDHGGIDIAVPAGTPVHSIADGEVVQAGWHYTAQDKGFGLYVEVRHADGSMSRYAHLSEATVQVGETIKAGHPIALSGNTGRSTGPHLHLEYLGPGYSRRDPLNLYPPHWYKVDSNA